MCQIIDLSRLSNRVHLLILFIFIIVPWCAVTKKVQVKPSPIYPEERKVDVKPSPLPIYPEEKIERNDFSVTKGDDIIGRLAVLRLENGDTLPILQDTSVWGWMQSVQQIQGRYVGAWSRQRILLPLSFILPDAQEKGSWSTWPLWGSSNLKEIVSRWLSRPTRSALAWKSDLLPSVKCMWRARQSGRPGMCLLDCWGSSEKRRSSTG